MNRYEYCRVSRNAHSIDTLDEALTELGREGWRVISTTKMQGVDQYEGLDFLVCILEREIA